MENSYAEQKMEELRAKIEDYRERIKSSQIKTTLKDVVEDTEPLSISLQPKKTLMNKETKDDSTSKKKKDQAESSGPVVPLNSVFFNQNEKFQ